MSPVRRLNYVSHASIPSGSANSIQVMKMCAALAESCEEVVLYCRATGADTETAHTRYGTPTSFRIAGIRAPRIRLIGRLLYSLRLLDRLRKDEASGLLYGRDYHTLALSVLLDRPRLPIVLEVHQPPGNALEKRLLRTIVASERFRHLVCISRALADEYERLFGELVAGRITVAPDGADARPADASGDGSVPGDSPAGGRGRSGLSLGYVGNLYPGKGMERIAELAGLLPDCSFEVVGGERGDVDRWRARIRSDNVTFHGRRPHAEAQEHMRSCDVLLAPYQKAVLIGGDDTDIGRWMSPLKVFEYMASGRPMVASDLPVLREVLRDRQNALLADPDDADSWVARIRELERDPDLRRALGERSQKDLVERYTWSRRARNILGGLNLEAGLVSAGST